MGGDQALKGFDGSGRRVIVLIYVEGEKEDAEESAEQAEEPFQVQWRLARGFHVRCDLPSVMGIFKFLGGGRSSDRG